MFDLIAYTIGADMLETASIIGTFKSEAFCEGRLTNYKSEMNLRNPNAVHQPWRFRLVCVRRDEPKLQKTSSKRHVFTLQMYVVRSPGAKNSVVSDNRSFEDAFACQAEANRLLAEYNQKKDADPSTRLWFRCVDSYNYEPPARFQTVPIIRNKASKGT